MVERIRLKLTTAVGARGGVRVPSTLGTGPMARKAETHLTPTVATRRAVARRQPHDIVRIFTPTHHGFGFRHDGIPLPLPKDTGVTKAALVSAEAKNAQAPHAIVRNNIRDAAKAFDAADAEGDQKLDFHRFKQMVHVRKHTNGPRPAPGSSHNHALQQSARGLCFAVFSCPYIMSLSCPYHVTVMFLPCSYRLVWKQHISTTSRCRLMLSYGNGLHLLTSTAMNSFRRPNSLRWH